MVKKKNENLSTYLSEIAVQGIQEKKRKRYSEIGFKGTEQLSF